MGKKKKNKKKWGQFNYPKDKSFNSLVDYNSNSEQIRAIALKVFGSNYYSSS